VVSILFVGYLIMQGMRSEHHWKDVTKTLHSSVQPNIEQDRPTSHLPPNMYGNLGHNLRCYRSLSKLRRPDSLSILSRLHRSCLFPRLPILSLLLVYPKRAWIPHRCFVFWITRVWGLWRTGNCRHHEQHGRYSRAACMEVSWQYFPHDHTN
jgi:hypothetical protein